MRRHPKKHEILHYYIYLNRKYELQRINTIIVDFHSFSKNFDYFKFLIIKKFST
jgi:hypothetical protein